MEKRLIERITVDPLVMSGHPCIRGMRVTVSNILRLLANHHSYQQILNAYPYLEAADIDACLHLAPEPGENMNRYFQEVVDAHQLIRRCRGDASTPQEVLETL